MPMIFVIRPAAALAGCEATAVNRGSFEEASRATPALPVANRRTESPTTAEIPTAVIKALGREVVMSFISDAACAACSTPINRNNAYGMHRAAPAKPCGKNALDTLGTRTIQ